MNPAKYATVLLLAWSYVDGWSMNPSKVAQVLGGCLVNESLQGGLSFR